MQAYTSAQQALLEAPAITITGGAELLSTDLMVTEDITDDVVSITTSRNNQAKIHGTVRLALTRELAWGVDLLRTRMTVSDGTTSATWYTGVWSLVTPQRAYDDDPTTWDASGFDRLYLLDRQIGASYQGNAGTGVLAAVRSVITDAGLSGVLLDGSAESSTLPRDLVYPLSAQSPTTWLQVINDLLGQVSYRGLYADPATGVYRSEPYANPSARPIEWTFSEGALTIQEQGRTLTSDLWGIPNRWVFRQQNRASGAAAPTEGDGIYTVNNTSTGPSSQTSRGLVWASVIDYDAADQTSLVALGDRRVAADLRTSAAWKVGTGPLPIAGHDDVVTLVVAGGAHKVQAHSWSLPHDGSPMQWDFDEVIPS